MNYKKLTIEELKVIENNNKKIFKMLFRQREKLILIESRIHDKMQRMNDNIKELLKDEIKLEKVLKKKEAANVK